MTPGRVSLRRLERLTGASRSTLRRWRDEGRLGVVASDGSMDEDAVDVARRLAVIRGNRIAPPPARAIAPADQALDVGRALADLVRGFVGPPGDVGDLERDRAELGALRALLVNAGDSVALCAGGEQLAAAAHHAAADLGHTLPAVDAPAFDVARADPIRERWWSAAETAVDAVARLAANGNCEIAAVADLLDAAAAAFAAPPDATEQPADIARAGRLAKASAAAAAMLREALEEPATVAPSPPVERARPERRAPKRAKRAKRRSTR